MEKLERLRSFRVIDTAFEAITPKTGDRPKMKEQECLRAEVVKAGVSLMKERSAVLTEPTRREETVCARRMSVG